MCNTSTLKKLIVSPTDGPQVMMLTSTAVSDITDIFTFELTLPCLKYKQNSELLLSTINHINEFGNVRISSKEMIVSCFDVFNRLRNSKLEQHCNQQMTL